MHRHSQQPSPPTSLLQALAEFRYHLRSFLQFSEQVAQGHDLRPRQHQLLLQIAGLPEGRSATINFLAERLGLRQNSVVELADRSVAQGLVRRVEDAAPFSLSPPRGWAFCTPCRRATRASWTSSGRN